MQIYQLADLTFGVEGASEYTLDVMKDYSCPEPVKGRPQIAVSVTGEMLERERRIQEGRFNEEYRESIAVYRAFCEKALFFDTVFFHASAVEKDGEAYLFSAPPGNGKSTHTTMWREAFGSSVMMINDDKPLIRFLNGRAYVYGAPWEGKNHLGNNVRVPIKGICFIERGERNAIRRIGFAEAKPLANDQSLHAAGWELQQKNAMLLNRLINQVPVYRMECTATRQAAVMAYEAMSKEIPRLI